MITKKITLKAKSFNDEVKQSEEMSVLLSYFEHQIKEHQLVYLKDKSIDKSYIYDVVTNDFYLLDTTRCSDKVHVAIEDYIIDKMTTKFVA